MVEIKNTQIIKKRKEMYLVVQDQIFYFGAKNIILIQDCIAISSPLYNFF